MLVILLLSAVAAATTDYSVPIYENPDIVVPEDKSHSTCFYDCHQHLLRYGTYVLRRDLDHAHDAQEPSYAITYAPYGINQLQKPELDQLLAVLSKMDRVGVVYSYNNFQEELFPGALDAQMTIPEHMSTFKVLQLEHPILVLLTKEEFKQIEKKEGLKKIADLGVSDQGFYIAKDYAIFRTPTTQRRRVGLDIHFNE